MIWLIWRQHRMTMIIAIVILLTLSIIFVQDANMMNAAMQQHHFTHGKVVENFHCIGIFGPYFSVGGVVLEQDGVQRCLNEHHIKPLVEYQRFDERFWPLQFVTTALLLGLTLLFAMITYWQMQRRLL